MFLRKFYLFFLFSLVSLTHSTAFSASCSFSWLPNSETTLAGYRIHYGTTSRQYSQSVNVGKPAAVNGRISATITGLNDGTSYFTAATAYDTSGTQSGYSTEVICSTPAANGQPTAQSSSFTVQENSTYSGSLAGTDPDNDPLVFTLASQARNGSVTLNNNGTFTYTDSSTAASSDSFTFTVSDGKSTSAPATVSVTISPAGTLPIEVGEVSINQNPVRITFAQPFTQPVIITNTITRNGADPCVVRISDVDANGFTIRLQEWDYLDGSHAQETVSYMVMEKGRHTLANGSMIEAGLFETAATTAAPQSFTQPLMKKPVLLTSIMSNNEPAAVTGRIRNISTSGFEYFLQEQENNPLSHAKETVAYIAWEPGNGVQDGMRFAVNATASSISHKNASIAFGQTFPAKPMLLAGMQTVTEVDTCALRITSTTTSGMTLYVQEEKSKDTEITHAKESAGYIAILAE